MVSLETHQKDGGVFVQFTYDAGDPASTLKSLQNALREEAAKHGGMPSWIGMAKGDAWLVKGAPWKEVIFTFILNNFLFLLLRDARICTGSRLPLSNSHSKDPRFTKRSSTIFSA